MEIFFVCLLSKKVLIKLWKHECKSVIADRFTTLEDVKWFDAAVAKLIEEEFEGKTTLLNPEIDAFFVDFLRDVPQRTGKMGSGSHCGGRSGEKDRI